MNCPNCNKPVKIFLTGYQCPYCGLEEYDDREYAPQ